MVYTKPDGTHGFSWQRQYEHLLREHPTQLEEIAHAKFEKLAQEHPDQAAHYRDLDERLRARIDAESDRDPDFGFGESNLTTQAFVRENDLKHLFADVPALSSKIDEFDFSLLEEDDGGTERLVELTEDNFDAWLQGITLD